MRETRISKAKSTSGEIDRAVMVQPSGNAASPQPEMPLAAHEA